MIFWLISIILFIYRIVVRIKTLTHIINNQRRFRQLDNIRHYGHFGGNRILNPNPNINPNLNINPNPNINHRENLAQFIDDIINREGNIPFENPNLFLNQVFNPILNNRADFENPNDFNNQQFSSSNNNLIYDKNILK